jgi:acyl-homoserine lactone acylase PvdQ
MLLYEKIYLLLFVVFQLNAQNLRGGRNCLGKQAKDVTIHRDKWGFLHVEGKNRRRCFGLIYAQCEDARFACVGT